MEILWFTIAGIALYLGSDRLLDWLELRRGKRFEHRDLIFFGIILAGALLLFELIQRLAGRA